ncbi:hypothetical protein KFK09_012991 [Dendrobium nobile]|uniref:Uncharacterized protein n=1 Tax=Dendrobium nobile TaxID=94219 RepID=A0A8T3BH03_DENNO|nr:hypothetical protein KFK09_012991 [Dendrobium nobile]
MESAAARGSHVGFSPSIRSLCRVPPKSFSAGHFGFLCRRRQRTPLPLLRAAYTLDSHNGDEPVDVIGIGSRKDSIIDFCLASPAVSASRFRFWTIYSRDQKKVQLLERCHSKDVFIRNVEFPLAPHSCLSATILVASAGHDLDQIAALDILCSVKSVGGLAIAIVLKPFSFEGQRRQKEVNDLVNKLKLCSNFYVVVEADSFFKAEIGTLAEALESANNTVLLAMWTISSMISNTHANILCTSEGKVKDVKPSEVMKVFDGYGELKIYHGAGYSVNAAIMQAIFHCPLFVDGLKGFNRLAIMLLTSSCNIGENDMLEINSSFRGITGYSGEIIFSKMCEPNLEPKFVVTTLLLMGKQVKEGRSGEVVGGKEEQTRRLETQGRWPRFWGEACGRGDGGKGGKSDGDVTELRVEEEGEPRATGEAIPVMKLQERWLNWGETYNAPMSKFGNQPSGGYCVMKQGSHEIVGVRPSTLLSCGPRKCSASRSNKNDKVDAFSLPVV